MSYQLKTFWFLRLKESSLHAWWRHQFGDVISCLPVLRPPVYTLFVCVLCPSSLPQQRSAGNPGGAGQGEEAAGPEPVHGQVGMSSPLHPQFTLMVSLFSSLQPVPVQSKPEGLQGQCRAAAHCCPAEGRPAGQRGVTASLFNHHRRPLTHTILCLCSTLTLIHRASSSLRTPHLGTSSSPSFHAWSLSHDPPFLSFRFFSCHDLSQGSNRFKHSTRWRTRAAGLKEFFFKT